MAARISEIFFYKESGKCRGGGGGGGGGARVSEFLIF